MKTIRKSPWTQLFNSEYVTGASEPTLVTRDSVVERQVLPKPATARFGRIYKACVLNNIYYGERHFVLREPLVVMAEEQVGGLWVHSCCELSIVSYGGSEENSRYEFDAEFAMAWDGLINEQDSNLTADARRLKARLHGLVARIEHYST
jgi:hypothetical protein